MLSRPWTRHCGHLPWRWSANRQVPDFPATGGTIVVPVRSRRRPGRSDAGSLAADVLFRQQLAAENDAAGRIRIYAEASLWSAAYLLRCGCTGTSATSGCGLPGEARRERRPRKHGTWAIMDDSMAYPRCEGKASLDIIWLRGVTIGLRGFRAPR